MPTTILNATFDGVSDVNALNGGTRSFDSRFMGDYSIYEENVANNLVANLSLTGNNWTVAALRIGAASFQTQLNLTDLDGSANRRINYLELGYNSDVDLISTKVRFISGFAGALHDISLGSGYVESMNLYAALNLVTTGTGYVGNIQIRDGVGNVTVNGNVGAINTDAQNDRVIVNSNSVTSISTGQGNDRVVAQGDSFVESVFISGGNNTIIARDTARIESLRMSNGDNTIRILDDARIRHIKLNEGDNTLITTGYVEGVTTWESSNNVTIGAGGIGSMIFYSDTRQTHVINATGYVENLRTTDSSSTATDDQTTRLTLGDAGAGSVFLGSGNDRVTTGDGYVDFLHTGRGNDIVNVGSGGMGTLVLHDGDDRVRVQNLDNVNTGLIIQGRAGTDTLDFSGISGVGVAFSLDASGAFQNIGAPGGDIDVPSVVGYFAETGIENLVGTLRRDLFTGDDGSNDLNGRGGLDTIHGGGGDDILRGQNGGDELNGDDGRDTIFGGLGDDTITGGADNDNMSGSEGADIFVFGTASGFDQIRDFDDGADVLRIADHAGGFGTLGLSDSGANLRVDYDGGTVLLIGMAGTVLTIADFDFI